MFSTLLKEHTKCLESLLPVEPEIIRAGNLLSDAVISRNKILICGNGGSAADSQHFAAEIIGRFEKERNAYPAIALTTDTSILTAVGNDYGYENVFSRQVEGLGVKNDALIGISTSGNSENVMRAVASAKKLGMPTIGLLGKDGGSIGEKVDIAIVVSNDVTARIQEAHIFILHFWASLIEAKLK